MNDDRKLMDYFLLVITTVIWGGAFVAAKVVVASMHPLIAASTRFLLAFLVLAPIMVYQERENAKIHLRDVPMLAVLGATGVFIYFLLFFYGLQKTSATNGSLLIAAGPGITAVMSALFLKESLSLKQMLGFIVSLGGVVVILTSGSPEALLNLRFNSGDLMLLVSTISWSVNSVLGKVAVGRFTPLKSTTYSIGFGALFLTIFSAPYWSKETIGQITPLVVFCMLFLSMIASALCFALWFRSLKSIGASKASVFMNIVPLSAATLATLLLGEELKTFHLIGAVLVLGGATLVTGIFTTTRAKNQI